MSSAWTAGVALIEIEFAPVAADDEDLAPDAEGDVRLPGQDLLGLGQGHRDRPDIGERRHLGVSPAGCRSALAGAGR